MCNKSSLLIIFLVLLMLIEIISSDSCSSAYDDVPSKAIVADIVFQGIMLGKYANDQREIFKAYFSVDKVLKGHLPRQSGNGRTPYKPVVVGDFGPTDKKACIAPLNTRSNNSYIVYLNDNEDPNIPIYKISSFPQLTARNVLRSIRKTLCDNCAQAPVVDLKPKLLEVENDGEVLLKCQVTGNPKPVVRWFKDGEHLKPAPGLTISDSKRKTSKLKIRKASTADSGVYQCQALNVLGETTEDTMVIVREMSLRESHEDLCPQQTYCLNGGVCYYMKTLGTEFCKCSHRFKGARCQLKAPLIVIDPKTGAQQDELHLDRTMTITGLVIAGLVVAGLFLTAYCMARHKRIAHYKKRDQKVQMKQEIKRALQEANKKQKNQIPPCHLVNTHKNPTRSTTTQTDTDWLLSRMSPDVEKQNIDEVDFIPPNSRHHRDGNQILPDYQRPPGYNFSPDHHKNSHRPGSGRKRLPAVSLDSKSNGYNNYHRSTAPPSNVAIVSAIVENEHPKHSSPSKTQTSMGRGGNRVPQEDNCSRGSRESRGSKDNAPIPQGYLEMDQCSEYDNQVPSDIELQIISDNDTRGLNMSGDEADFDGNQIFQPNNHLANNRQQAARRHRRHSSSSESSECASDSSSAEEQALFKKVQAKPRLNSIGSENRRLTDHSDQEKTSIVEPWEDFNNHYYTTNNIAFSPYAKQNELLDNKSSGNIIHDTASLDRESII